MSAICKIDKIGIEILFPFVYNVFIVVLSAAYDRWRAEPSRKEINTYVHS